MIGLYDKRHEPDFASRILAIRLQLLQHMSCCLSANCQWNIFDGQFVRYQRIISDRDDSIKEVAHLIRDLSALAYPWHDLRERLRRRVLSAPVLYGVARGTSWALIGSARPPGIFGAIPDAVDRHE